MVRDKVLVRLSNSLKKKGKKSGGQQASKHSKRPHSGGVLAAVHPNPPTPPHPHTLVPHRARACACGWALGQRARADDTQQLAAAWRPPIPPPLARPRCPPT